MIAELNERLAAPPAALPPPTTWASLDRASEEYRRVTFTAEFDDGREALVYAAPSALRPDVLERGFWVLAPARLDDGSAVVVDRGFVPNDRRDPNTRSHGQIAGAVSITGMMRWPETGNWFTPKGDPAHNLWFIRDPAAIAAAKGWRRIAPFYVAQEGPVPPGGLPRPGKIVAALPNNHLQYAITWYGLALVLAVTFILWARALVASQRGSPGRARGASLRSRSGSEG